MAALETRQGVPIWVTVFLSLVRFMTVEQAAAQTLNFQAEVKQLLHLMIHSLYSNRRSSCANWFPTPPTPATSCASRPSNNGGLFEDDAELKIRVAFDKAARTLTISDNGIGMSRAEVVTNLGTIAKSGTKEFFGKLTGDQKKDAHLIGQFGVGFYSPSSSPTRLPCAPAAPASPPPGVQWECSMTGDTAGEYTVEPIDKAARGTEITLHLRDGPGRPAVVVEAALHHPKYSDHILQPIVMKKERDEDRRNRSSPTRTRPSTRPTPCGRAQERHHRRGIHRSSTSTSATTTKTRWPGPTARSRAATEYTQLLYMPGPPFDLWDRNARHGVKLYVRRVFIMDDAES